MGAVSCSASTIFGPLQTAVIVAAGQTAEGRGPDLLSTRGYHRSRKTMSMVKELSGSVRQECVSIPEGATLLRLKGRLIDSRI